jgi:TPP-dependent pyruvate/acetoin dehydrogenase alpha subunit
MTKLPDEDELVPLCAGAAELPADTLVGWLRTMLLIREFERVTERLAGAGKIPGGMHSSAGQEATAVGPIAALGDDDVVTSSHRSHHHALAKGLSPEVIMAELFGKRDGCQHGRGGHMHLADFSLGLFGSNGIVGGGLGIAMGVSLAMRLRELPRVAMAFFGDGGANTGRVWEIINMASLWKLPVIVICENNLYAVETHLNRATAGGSIAKRASGFGLPVNQVDGQDVVAMHVAVREARERALAGDGPTFIEAFTYRYDGHNTGDPQNYRTSDEVASWRAKDPIDRVLRELMIRGALRDGDIDALRNDATARVRNAVDFAEQSPWPDPGSALAAVTSLSSPPWISR